MKAPTRPPNGTKPEPPPAPPRKREPYREPAPDPQRCKLEREREASARLREAIGKPAEGQDIPEAC